MDPTQVTSLTTVLTALGLGKYTAGIVSLIIGGHFIAGALLTFLPVADGTSGKGYNAIYGFLAWYALNFGKNAPVPPSGFPAGGAVPAPPAKK